MSSAYYDPSDYADYGQISSGGMLPNRNNCTMQKDNRWARSRQVGQILPIAGRITTKKSPVPPIKKMRIFRP
jgi:hypothetical protein